MFLQYGHSVISDGEGFNGCYASHIVLRRGTSVFPIADNVSDRVAAPINCALATMMNAISQIPKDGCHKRAVIQVEKNIFKTVYVIHALAVCSRLFCY